MRKTANDFIHGLDVRVDNTNKVLTIEGVRYSFEFFSHMGEHGFPVGTDFRVEKRKDGLLQIIKLRDPEEIING